MPKYNMAQTGDHLRVLDNLKVMPWHVEGGFQRVSSSSTLTVSSTDFETTCIYYWFQASANDFSLFTCSKSLTSQLIRIHSTASSNFNKSDKISK